MKLIKNLLVLMAISAFIGGVFSDRGCYCILKFNDNGKDLATHHTRVGGFLAQCWNRQRYLCNKACRNWANNGYIASSSGLTKLCKNHGAEIAPNSCNGDGMKLIVYSKLDCDGSNKQHKQVLSCDKTVCCCKETVQFCHGVTRIFFEGYFCKSIPNTSGRGAVSYHSSKKQSLASRKIASCKRTTTIEPKPFTPHPDSDEDIDSEYYV